MHDVRRVLTGGRTSGGLKDYLRTNPLINNDLLAGGEVHFRIPGNPTVAIGSEATRLIEICEKYLQASEQGKLRSNQEKLAVQAGIIIRACALLLA